MTKPPPAFCTVRYRRAKPKMSDSRKITIKTINKILAKLAAAPAIPVKPSRAAMIAMTKNIRAHLNMPIPSPNRGALTLNIAGER